MIYVWILNFFVFLVFSQGLFLEKDTVDFEIFEKETFVSVKIDDKQIQSRVRVVQKALRALDSGFSKTLIPLNSLHLTFNFYNISKINFKQAQKSLQISAESYVWHFGSFNLSFQGLDTFNDDNFLVFLPTVESAEKIDSFYRIMIEAFKEHGLSPSKNYDFSPHVVIAALRTPEEQKLKEKLKLFRIDDFFIGNQKIQALDLCSKTINPLTGYFDILAQAEFN